ncbi:MAG: MoaD/ThiS family protein [Bacteroidia bacterium]|nr:MoaD/ThiS family protein [Bacteroidia bacterium]NND25531.1 MoaD/ThiS family protein [Flavobacteriaceae bacterium]MBT8279154.1 MoaD/ThiS family protein [Bacteroidia bacterium]NNK60842.1 MoaD/ThiS family protein [Flavobacteriaceae bacterium]NNL33867.1 MoaD/ThiS family protein [Flavobacteriaceae bacterium]
MELTIKYFGMISELTSCEEEKILFEQTTISELLKDLFKKYPDLKNKDFRIAQDRKLVSLDSLISGQELALLPPFAGG